MLKEGNKVYLLQQNIKTKRLNNKLDNKKLRLFEINKKLRDVMFKLKLPRTIQIHLVFYISLLELALPRAPPTPITKIEAQEE